METGARARVGRQRTVRVVGERFLENRVLGLGPLERVHLEIERGLPLGVARVLQRDEIPLRVVLDLRDARRARVRGRTRTPERDARARARRRTSSSVLRQCATMLAHSVPDAPSPYFSSASWKSLCSSGVNAAMPVAIPFQLGERIGLAQAILPESE